MDGVVHFEIPVDDVERAKAFYGTVFDWQMQAFPDMQYTLAMTTPVDEQSQRPTTPGAINGGLMSRSKETPAPVITPSTPIPGMGSFGYFTDPEGNVMGLFQST